jgi:hypothetical protein
VGVITSWGALKVSSRQTPKQILFQHSHTQTIQLTGTLIFNNTFQTAFVGPHLSSGRGTLEMLWIWMCLDSALGRLVCADDDLPLPTLTVDAFCTNLQN